MTKIETNDASYGIYTDTDGAMRDVASGELLLLPPALEAACAEQEAHLRECERCEIGPGC